MRNSVKRITLASFAVAILLIQPNLVLAKFGGILRNDETWTLELTPGGESAATTAMTVTFVDSKGRQDLDIFTMAPNDRSLVAYSGARIPGRTRRIIIDLDLPSNGVVQLRIIQGITVMTVDCIDQNGSGSRVVFDVD